MKFLALSLLFLGLTNANAGRFKCNKLVKQYNKTHSQTENFVSNDEYENAQESLEEAIGITNKIFDECPYEKADAIRDRVKGLNCHIKNSLTERLFVGALHEQFSGSMPIDYRVRLAKRYFNSLVEYKESTPECSMTNTIDNAIFLGRTFIRENAAQNGNKCKVAIEKVNKRYTSLLNSLIPIGQVGSYKILFGINGKGDLENVKRHCPNGREKAIDIYTTNIELACDSPITDEAECIETFVSATRDALGQSF